MTTLITKPIVVSDTINGFLFFCEILPPRENPSKIFRCVIFLRLVITDNVPFSTSNERSRRAKKAKRLQIIEIFPKLISFFPQENFMSTIRPRSLDVNHTREIEAGSRRKQIEPKLHAPRERLKKYMNATFLYTVRV